MLLSNKRFLSCSVTPMSSFHSRELTSLRTRYPSALSLWMVRIIITLIIIIITITCCHHHYLHIRQGAPSTDTGAYQKTSSDPFPCPSFKVFSIFGPWRFYTEVTFIILYIFTIYIICIIYDIVVWYYYYYYHHLTLIFIKCNLVHLFCRRETLKCSCQHTRTSQVVWFWHQCSGNSEAHFSYFCFKSSWM